MFPALSEEYSSVHISGAARVNGKALRNALVNAAKKNGAKIIEGNAELLYENNRVTGVAVNGQTLLASTTIVTAGAWANQLLEPLGVKFLASFQKRKLSTCIFLI